MPVGSWTLSVPDRDALIAGAVNAKEFSYSPYSRFRVGAALLTSEGHIVKGTNVENASYGGTICAERTAIVKAVSDGMRSFVGLAVITDVPSPVSPCGMCRQFMREFCALEMPVLLIPSDYPQRLESNTVIPAVNGRIGEVGEGGVRETTLGELLPDSFGPEFLELPRR